MREMIEIIILIFLMDFLISCEFNIDSESRKFVKDVMKHKVVLSITFYVVCPEKILLLNVLHVQSLYTLRYGN